MEGNRIILDSGALSALAEKGSPLRLVLDRVLSEKGNNVLVPTVVIAESTTGDHRRDANVNRLLKSAAPISLDASIARSAAVLRHALRRAGAGTIDAIVVATADMVAGSEVLTGDDEDLTRLASVNGQTRVIAISEALQS